jgi:uncharacterized protein with HEPN domain
MSNRDWKILFEDIIESINKIENYSKDISFEDFSESPIIIDAVVRNIEIIGEASKNVPVETQNKFKDIPWQKIKGIRNRIVHEYFSVDISIIWFIVKNELQSLKNNLTEHLDKD